MSDRAPNIRDVARVAGVSYQTVSRLLNDSPSIRPETRARVQAAIDELGFRPNQAARALGTGRTRTIGLLTGQTDYYGPMTAIHAIELAARDAGYRITITTSDGAEGLLAQRVEAIIVLAPQQRMPEATGSIPVIHLDPTGIAIDQVAGARLAVRHLVELGHERILHIAGPADWSDALGRVDGYRAELHAAGLEPLSIATGDWSAASGYRIGRELLAAPAFTAVFAANDQTALGVAHAARVLGIRIPEDLSLVGFDDVPEAAYFTPPLTTVRQDFGEVGRRAVAAALASLDGGRPEALLLQPELIVRESTAPR